MLISIKESWLVCYCARRRSILDCPRDLIPAGTFPTEKTPLECPRLILSPYANCVYSRSEALSDDGR